MNEPGRFVLKKAPGEQFRQTFPSNARLTTPRWILLNPEAQGDFKPLMAWWQMELQARATWAVLQDCLWTHYEPAAAGSCVREK